MRKLLQARQTDLEQRRAAAIASLHRDWELARKSGADKIPDAEIAEVRAALVRLHPPASR